MSAGEEPLWLSPYRKPSPTSVGVAVGEARLTLSDSAVAAALTVGVSSGSARTSAAAIVARPALVLRRLLARFLRASTIPILILIPRSSRHGF